MKLSEGNVKLLELIHLTEMPSYLCWLNQNLHAKLILSVIFFSICRFVRDNIYGFFRRREVDVKGKLVRE